MTSIYANLWEQKNVFTEEKSSTPTGLVWDTNMTFDLWFEHLYGRSDIILKCSIPCPRRNCFKIIPFIYNTVVLYRPMYELCHRSK